MISAFRMGLAANQGPMKSVISSDRHMKNQRERDALHQEPDFSGKSLHDGNILITWILRLNYDRYIFVVRLPNFLHVIKSGAPLRDGHFIRINSE